MTPRGLRPRVVAALSDDLRRAPWRGSPNRLAGHCYVASEAAWHLLGAFRGPWRPQFIRHEDAPHWYLRNLVTRRVLDLTAGQFATPVPYAQGRGCGFLTRRPSKRAQKVLTSIPQCERM